MTTPGLNTNTEILETLANGHQLLLDEFTTGGGPPQIQVAGEWDSAAAADAVLGAQRAAKARQAAQLQGNVDNLRATAGQYQGQEAGSAKKLGAGLGEIGGLLGPIIGPIGQIAGQVVSAGGALTQGLVAAAATPSIGLIGALSNAGATMDGHPHPANIGPSSGLLGPEADGLEHPADPGSNVHLRSDTHTTPLHGAH